MNLILSLTLIIKAYRVLNFRHFLVYKSLMRIFLKRSNSWMSYYRYNTSGNTWVFPALANMFINKFYEDIREIQG